MQRVGIPRALLYYDYYPLWRGFFCELGYEVVTSPTSNEQISHLGSSCTAEEVCFPVKLAHGHARYLVEQGVDYLFIPRLVSVERDTYICPKFMGLPDMMRYGVPNLPVLISPVVDLHKGKTAILTTLRQVAEFLKISSLSAYKAYWVAFREWKKYRCLLQMGLLPRVAMQVLYDPDNADLSMPRTRFNIAVLGHPYDIYDPYISMGLAEWLEKRGARVHTADMLSDKTIACGAATLPKKLFWSLGERIVGAANYYATQQTIDGLVQIISFGCGLESLVVELVKKHALNHSHKPYLLLTVDEHTAEAGMVTRLEAFMDMLTWRRRTDESNVSAHG